MTPAVLAPGTRVCPDCEGVGRIRFSGVHPSRLGGVGDMETPDVWTEACINCDGRGIVDDRREAVRDEEDLWTDYQRVSVRCVNLATKIKRLEREIAALKEARNE